MLEAVYVKKSKINAMSIVIKVNATSVIVGII